MVAAAFAEVDELWVGTLHGRATPAAGGLSPLGCASGGMRVTLRCAREVGFHRLNDRGRELLPGASSRGAETVNNTSFDLPVLPAQREESGPFNDAEHDWLIGCGNRLS